MLDGGPKILVRNTAVDTEVRSLAKDSILAIFRAFNLRYAESAEPHVLFLPVRWPFGISCRAAFSSIPRSPMSQKPRPT